MMYRAISYSRGAPPKSPPLVTKVPEAKSGLTYVDSEEVAMTVATQTVRDIALENPASIRVFEKFGIDYCCGGRKPLTEACEANSIAVDEVIAALERAGAEPVPQAANWA